MPERMWYEKLWVWVCRPYWAVRYWWSCFRGTEFRRCLAIKLGLNPAFASAWPPTDEQLHAVLEYILEDRAHAHQILDATVKALCRGQDGILIAREDIPTAAANAVRARDRYNTARIRLMTELQALKGHSAR